MYYSKKYWIHSISWDSFWMMSGIWITFLFILLDSIHIQETFYMVGLFLFWISHRFSSFYIAWFSYSYKPLRRDQKKRFIIIPVLIIVSVLSLLFAPEISSSFTLHEKLLGLLLLDFFWGTHHFAAQHYGIIQIYHKKYNLESTDSSKRKDRFFCWGIGGAMVVLAELLHGTSFLQEKHLLPYHFSNFGTKYIGLMIDLGTLLGICVTLFMIYDGMLKAYSFPKILYLSSLGLMVVAAFQLDPIQFIMLWTLQHWLASLGLAIHIQGNQISMESKKKNFSEKNRYKKNSLKLWMTLIYMCTFSAIMTPFFEIEAASAGNRYTEQIWPSLMVWLENSDLYKFLVGVGIASGFLHYWMDRAVYRFSDLQTRNIISNLIFPSQNPQKDG